MARKNLLEGLMQAATEPADESTLPRYERGAIGAVSRGISDLKRRAIVEVQPDLIDNAGMRDRLDKEDADLETLAESIREYGQQVPVLLRHHPNIEGRYEIVYGRRRVAALKALKQPVKAMVRQLDDRELVIAQGQENTARKDLSFIEKALFAQQMAKAGYDRKIICDALSIDKTVISRMLSVVDTLPPKLILAIGTAPSIGRDRWLSLLDRARGSDLKAAQRAAIGATSDERFDAVFRALRSTRQAPVQPRQLTDENGKALALARASKNKLVIEIPQVSRDFGEWLVDNLHELHRTWLQSTGSN